MLLDAQRYRFSAALQRGFATFRRELAQLSRADFLEWPDRAAYGGTWLVAPLFMSSHIDGIEDRFEATQARCPASTAALRDIPGVTAAAFSWMEPSLWLLDIGLLKHLMDACRRQFPAFLIGELNGGNFTSAGHGSEFIGVSHECQVTRCHRHGIGHLGNG